MPSRSRRTARPPTSPTTRSGTVTPITTATNTAGTPITVGRRPDAIAITPDGKTAYVTNYCSGTVTPITTATNTPGTPITVGNDPDAIAITPDGKTAYVVNYRRGHGDPDPTATNTAGTPITVGGDPSIAITPDGKTAYVTNAGSGTVTPITTATNTAGTPITVGSGPDASRSRRTGRPPTSPIRLGHGDPDPDRYQYGWHADHSRSTPRTPSRSRHSNPAAPLGLRSCSKAHQPRPRPAPRRAVNLWGGPGGAPADRADRRAPRRLRSHRGAVRVVPVAHRLCGRPDFPGER